VGLGSQLPFATLIADNVHVPPHVLRAALSRFGRRAVLVSDANPVVGDELVDGKKWDVLNTQVEYRAKDGSVRVPGGGLAGGAKSLLECANTLLSMDLATPAEVVQMGYAAPLELLGLDRLEYEKTWGTTRQIGFSADTKSFGPTSRKRKRE